MRRVDTTSEGAWQLVCDGVSELVREQEAVFLSSLEEIEFLDPAETRLTPDLSPSFVDSRLYMESQLRATVPNDERIHVGHQAAMDLVRYQLDPARQALARPRQRILIADAVGLGKTLEAGILVSELIARGRGRRILVLVLKSRSCASKRPTRGTTPTAASSSPSRRAYRAWAFPERPGRAIRPTASVRRTPAAPTWPSAGKTSVALRKASRPAALSMTSSPAAQ